MPDVIIRVLMNSRSNIAPTTTLLAGLALLATMPCETGAANATTARTLLLDARDAKRDRTVPLKVYLPASTRPQPVILFSHGLGGSRENNAYVGKHWAEHGYVAVFMQHLGSDESVWKNESLAKRFTALKRAASLRSSLDRYHDVPFVIDQLERWNRVAGHQLGGRMDLEHIGLCGHSYGAVTTLALMGQKFPLRRTFGDERIDAFLPMSPQPGKGLSPERSLGHIQAPVLCMTGTKDGSPIDPKMTPATRRLVYAALPAGDKYQLVFEGGEHFAFGDSGGFRTRGRNPNHHPAIQQISTKFWDAYLRNDREAKAWLQSKTPRTDCGLAAKDVWQWK